jgi:methionyl-tRNA formyltransferase
MSGNVVYIGTPEFAVPPLQQLCRDGIPVTAVYTQPDRPGGRGRQPLPPPVKTAARALGLPVYQPASFKDSAVTAQLAEFHPEVMVVAAFGQLLPRAVLDIAPLGCVNLHPSLLPRFRGASPVAAAILAGDEFTGVSLMLLDSGMDTGPVVAQAQLPVLPADTTGSLTGKLSRLAAAMLPDVLLRLQRGEIMPRPQAAGGVSYCGTITKADGRIDWTRPAAEIWRRVRAFQPWPGSYTQWEGKQLRILEAVALQEIESPGAGKVISLEAAPGNAVYGVGCGEGTLGIKRLQLEGKKAVDAVDFVRGYRDFIGAVLGE